MKNPFEKLLLLLAGLALAIFFHLGLYQTPQGMANIDQIITDHSGNNQILIADTKIVGIDMRINYAANDRGADQINEHWEGFFSDSSLQSIVDWSQTQTVIAYYDKFSEDGTSGNLTIGFTDANVADPNSYSTVQLVAGNYIHYTLDPPTGETVSTVWKEIMNQAKFPIAVIERYALDTMGESQEIQMQVLYP